MVYYCNQSVNNIDNLNYSSALFGLPNVQRENQYNATDSLSESVVAKEESVSPQCFLWLTVFQTSRKQEIILRGGAGRG